jgi:hypothetical protein
MRKRSGPFNPLFLMAAALIVAAPSSAQVSVTNQNATRAGVGCLEITTPVATYYFSKAGGSFAAILDKDGKDWVGFSQTADAGGKWRGCPKIYSAGWMPEGTGSTTTIVSQTSGKVTIKVVKGQYECTWDFFPACATMTMTRTAGVYNFTYEGAPYGGFSNTTQFLVTGAAKQRQTFSSINEINQDIAAENGKTHEWFFIGDTRVKRSMFFVNHIDDNLNDLFKNMNPMAVFAFGRKMSTTEYITTVPHKFSIGLVEDSSIAPVTLAIQAAVDGSVDVQCPFRMADRPGEADMRLRETGMMLFDLSGRTGPSSRAAGQAFYGVYLRRYGDMIGAEKRALRLR